MMPRENKATAAAPVKHLCPTGQLDATVYARLLDGGTHGAVPLLDVRTWRRSPAELSEDAFVPTAGGFTLELQFAPALLEAIARVAGLRVTIAPAASGGGMTPTLTETHNGEQGNT